MLADKGKSKVWSHEESQVADKRDHLGLGLVLLASLSFQHDRIENVIGRKTCFVWLYVSKDDDKLYFIVCLRPGGGVIPQAVGLQGPDVVARNNMRKGDRGNTC